MNSQIIDCPNCKLKLTDNILKTIVLLSPRKNVIINEYHEPKAESYCNKCGNDLYNTYKSKMEAERENLSSQLHSIITSIPVVSTHSPLNWNYEILDMVTAQSTTGTGVISEFTSSFTDMFGIQSNRHNKKLKAGENLCFAQLRKNAINIGGNAVIATDIDYSEIGGDKGMLMVCMGGTAIKLTNLELLGEERKNNILQIFKLNERLEYLYRFDLSENNY